MLKRGMMNMITRITMMIFLMERSDRILPIFDYLFIAFYSYY